MMTVLPGGLFEYTRRPIFVSASVHYIALSDMITMSDELGNTKKEVVAVCLKILLERLRKTTKSLSQDYLCLVCDFNLDFQNTIWWWKMRVSENRELSRIVGPERGSGRLIRELRNEELHSLYYSPNVITYILHLYHIPWIHKLVRWQ
jgi:hypothetical protein